MINSESFHKYLQKELSVGDFISSRPLSGGDINEAFLLTFQDKKLFLKYHAQAAEDFFRSEAFSLVQLAKSKALQIPNVELMAEFDGHPFLILEYISPGIKGDDFDQRLGYGLAQIHSNRHDQFGWEHANYIGPRPQSNQWRQTWSDFYFLERLEPQFAMAFDYGYVNASDRRALERLASRLDELLPGEQPALLHGDLWSGNYMVSEEGKPVLIDPSSYYGHREMDLAMMKLFGGFNNAVFQSYEEIRPLEPGFEERLPIHQLYPLLVHLNLFGASYLNSCRQIWQKFS